MPPKPSTKKPAAKAKPKAKPVAKSKAKPKAEPVKAPRTIVGEHEAGLHYGVSSKSIYNWRREGMPAKELPGNRWEYNLDETDPWVAEKQQKAAQDEELAKIRKQKEETKLRIEKAKADQAERKNQLEEGNVLERDTWELFAAETIQEMRDGILRVPTFFHGHLCKKCQRKTTELKGQLEDVLIRFANKLREGPSDEE